MDKKLLYIIVLLKHLSCKMATTKCIVPNQKFAIVLLIPHIEFHILNFK